MCDETKPDQRFSDTPSQPPQGWHEDPQDPAVWCRFSDGTKWTKLLSPRRPLDELPASSHIRSDVAHAKTLAPRAKEYRVIAGRVAPPVADESIRVLIGHADYVNDCAVSPDGSYIVSASIDDTLRIWDAATGLSTRTLTEPRGLRGRRDPRRAMWTCAVAPDGSYIVSGGWGQPPRLWDPTNGKTIRKLKGHRCPTDCAVSPDGSYVVTASGETLRIWDPDSGRAKQTLAGHGGQVNACAVSSDGTYVVSGSMDKTVRIWNSTTGHAVHVLRGHTGPVSDCAVSPDGSFIVSAGDRSLRIWDPTSGEIVRVLTGHDGSVSACAVAPDGSYIVSGGDYPPAELSQVLPLDEFPPPTDRIVVEDLGIPDSTLRIWDTSTGETIATLTGHTAAVNACAIAPDGSYIVSAAGSGDDAFGTPRDDSLRLWTPPNH